MSAAAMSAAARISRALAATTLACVAAASGAMGQESGAAKREVTANSQCPRVDTTAAWYRKQRAWANESKHDWSNDTLRTALLRATGMDSSRASGALLGYEIVGGASGGAAVRDTAMLARLRALAANRQSVWPTRSVVGPAGVQAVWMLVARDTGLARTALHRMMEAGPDESPPTAVAIMEDRLRLLSGRKQIYGTQLVRKPDGSLEPAPTEDLAHVDLRRDGAGLPPLEVSLCAARSRPARGGTDDAHP